MISVVGAIINSATTNQSFKTIVKGAKLGSGAAAAVSLAIELDQCYANLGYFLADRPIIRDIIDGYRNHPWKCTNIPNNFDIEAIEACYLGQ